jgi:hypothetical protein
MLALERKEILCRIECVLEVRAMCLQMTTNPLHFAEPFSGASVAGLLSGVCIGP